MVDGVSGNRERDYSYAHDPHEPSTNQVLGQARKQAGLTEKVTIHGEDETYKELNHEIHAEYETGMGQTLHTAKAIYEGVKVAREVAHEGGLGPIEGIKIAGELMYHTGKDMNYGDRLGVAAARDQQHHALIATLDLPKGFQQQELAKYDGTLGGKPPSPSSAAGRLAQAIVSHPEERAMLQLQADRGSNIALDMIATGEIGEKGVALTLAAHPEVKERYENDAAFRAGFDAAVYANKQGGTEMGTFLARLQARDARYEQAHIEYRG